MTSKYIPPMMEAVFKDMPELFASAAMDVPPPIPNEALRQYFTPDFREELNAMEDEREVRLNRMRSAVFGSNNSRPRRYGNGRNYRRNLQPRTMNAKYAGTCAETQRSFDVGALILWVPSERACYIEDSETFQDYLLSAREASV